MIIESRASVGYEAERQMTRNQMDIAFAEVREKGLARAVERPIPGVNAFSAPVFDHIGSIALSITAIGPHTFDANWDGPVAEELRKCTATVSRLLGFHPKDRRPPDRFMPGSLSTKCRAIAQRGTFFAFARRTWNNRSALYLLGTASAVIAVPMLGFLTPDFAPAAV